MSNADDDKWVEKLLKDLGDEEEMSPLEIKRFEKQVDLWVAHEKEKTRSKRWIPQLSAVASVIVLLVGVAVFTDSSGILDDNAPISSPSTKPVSPTPVSSGDTNSGNDESDQQNTDTQEPDTDIGEYDAGESSKPNTSKKKVPVLRTGIDYEANLEAARNKVLPLARQGSFNDLSSAQIACSVELGIKDSLYAIDRGTYAGENIEAYYFGSSKTDLKIKIVAYGCSFVAELGLQYEKSSNEVATRPKVPPLLNPLLSKTSLCYKVCRVRSSA